jgi:hypothetical protein
MLVDVDFMLIPKPLHTKFEHCANERGVAERGGCKAQEFPRIPTFSTSEKRKQFLIRRSERNREATNRR